MMGAYSDTVSWLICMTDDQWGFETLTKRDISNKFILFALLSTSTIITKTISLTSIEFYFAFILAVYSFAYLLTYLMINGY